MPPPDHRTVHVAVVDRLPLDRELLAAALGDAEGLAVTHAACSLASGAPDGPADAPAVHVVLIRAGVPGIDLPAEVAAAAALPSQPRVVVLASYVDAYLVERLGAVGADAVASSHVTLAELRDLLRGAGRAPVPAVAPRRDLSLRHHLTAREAEILDHLADGLAPGQIAHLLGLRVSTIRDHVKSLRAKLDCSSATQLVVTAHRLGLVPHVGRPLR